MLCISVSPSCGGLQAPWKPPASHHAGQVAAAAGNRTEKELGTQPGEGKSLGRRGWLHGDTVLGWVVQQDWDRQLSPSISTIPLFPAARSAPDGVVTPSLGGGNVLLQGSLAQESQVVPTGVTTQKGLRGGRMRLFSCPPGEGNPWLELSWGTLVNKRCLGGFSSFAAPSEQKLELLGWRKAVKWKTQMEELPGSVGLG